LEAYKQLHLFNIPAAFSLFREPGKINEAGLGYQLPDFFIGFLPFFTLSQRTVNTNRLQLVIFLKQGIYRFEVFF
jgi:hypothetical protein